MFIIFTKCRLWHFNFINSLLYFHEFTIKTSRFQFLREFVILLWILYILSLWIHNFNFMDIMNKMSHLFSQVTTFHKVKFWILPSEILQLFKMVKDSTRWNQFCIYLCFSISTLSSRNRIIKTTDLTACTNKLYVN